MIILINNNKTIIKNNKKYKYKINNKIIYISANNIINEKKYIVHLNQSIILLKNNNNKIINILRHSAAHLMAHAIKNIYKKTKLAFGPVIKNGFYYDFKNKNEITTKNFNKIEKEMERLSKKKINIIKYNINKKNCKKIFKKNFYKLKIINKINTKYITCYKQKNFIDLCLGPHINNTKYIKYFKITKLSGAYWENDKKNEMLYRIYGTAWNTKKKLEKYLNDKIINKIDSKKIGYENNLFCLDEQSKGAIFWYKYGWNLYKNIIKYIRKEIFKNNFIEVNTPSLINSYLFEKSGHMSKFSSHIFSYKNEDNIDILKPMNCPCHINIFNNFKKKSYKDLPYRISEFGSCFRNELSGSLQNLMRVKNFIQDDGHIFCTIYQIKKEIKNFIKILQKTYYNFNFKIFKVTIAKKPKNILENNNIWKIAENILEKSIKELKINYSTSFDGAFYGPKIEISLKDKLERYWQCGTIQLDFFTSKRLNATYSDKKGNIQFPIILHRAILGSIERFIGIIIENNNGQMPFWITPIQFEIIYINNKHSNYSKKIFNIIKKTHKIRLSINNEKIEQKIKKCILEKIPYIITIGENEIKAKGINIRCFKNNNHKIFKTNKIIRKINKTKR